MTSNAPSSIPPADDNKLATLLSPVLPHYDKRTQDILAARFGLGVKPAMTIEETCQLFEISMDQYKSLIYGIYAYLTSLTKCLQRQNIADIRDPLAESIAKTLEE